MTNSAVRGTLSVGFEPTTARGNQTLLSPTVIATTQSVTTQPVVNSQGCRIAVFLSGIGAGASGTVTIAGLKPDGITAQTETSTAISSATADQNGNFYYCTTGKYSSVNASGITASSVSGALANAIISVYAITAGKWLVPAEATFEEKPDWFSPADHRGLLDEDVRMTQLIRKVSFDIKSALYPETDQFLGPICIGNAPTPNPPASIPATPTVLKASSSFTSLGASFTLTTAPTIPGMLLQFVIASNLLAGTLTITGTNRYNQSISEVVNVTVGTPNGTFYSQNQYTTVTSIAVTGFTAAATCTTNGVFAYNPVYNPMDTLLSAAAEWYSGTESAVISQLVTTDWELDYDVSKELTLNIKGEAQSKFLIGDLTQQSMPNSQFGTYVQPIDYPIPSWGGLFYLDPITGTAGNTQWLDIITMKIKGVTGQKPYWTAVGQQDFNRVGRAKRKVQADIEIDFTNVILYQKYRTGQKQLIVAKFQQLINDGYLGNNAGSPVYKLLQVFLAAKIEDFQITPSDEKVIGKLSLTAEYEPSLGYSHTMSFVNLNNPNYTL